MEYNSGSNRAERKADLKLREADLKFLPELYDTKSNLLINRNYNKIREEYDSGINYLTALYIHLLS